MVHRKALAVLDKNLACTYSFVKWVGHTKWKQIRHGIEIWVQSRVLSFGLHFLQNILIWYHFPQYIALFTMSNTISEQNFKALLLWIQINKILWFFTKDGKFRVCFDNLWKFLNFIKSMESIPFTDKGRNPSSCYPFCETFQIWCLLFKIYLIYAYK